MQLGSQVVKPGYGYFGRVIRVEQVFGQEFIRVSWEGSCATSREYRSELIEVFERPDRVVLYN